MALVAWTRMDVRHATNERAVSARVSPRGCRAGARWSDCQRRSRELGLQRSVAAYLGQRHQLDRRERDDGLTSAEREELRDLRKRVKRVEQERDILKRAAVLFAAETETR